MPKSVGGKVALGVAVGAVVGAAAGVLLAPKSGKETRADIKKKAGEIKIAAGKKAEVLKHDISMFGKHAENAVEGAKAGFSKEVK